MSYLANEDLRHSTIKCYLAAIRHLHVAQGVGDPNISSMAHLEQVLRGVKGVQAKTSKRLNRLPITPELLRKIRLVWVAGSGHSSWDNIMMWAACLLCFFGFLRSGEITVPLDSAFDDGAHSNRSGQHRKSPSHVNSYKVL